MRKRCSTSSACWQQRNNLSILKAQGDIATRNKVGRGARQHSLGSLPGPVRKSCAPAARQDYFFSDSHGLTLADHGHRTYGSLHGAVFGQWIEHKLRSPLIFGPEHAALTCL